MAATVKVVAAVAAAGSLAICGQFLQRYQRKPTAIVIGGTGLMGTPTVKLLKEQGFRVVVLSRGRETGQGTGGQRPASSKADGMVIADREDRISLQKAFEEAAEGGPLIVVDYCAMKPDHVRSILEIHAQKKPRISHYVFISTNMVYPGGPESMDVSKLSQGEELIKETEINHDFADSVPENYGGKKLRCEAMLLEAFKNDGFPVSIIRPPAVVGPGCDSRHEGIQRFVAGISPLPPRSRPATFAECRGAFRVAYSEDVALATVRAIEKGRAVHGEAFNIASDEDLKIADYMDQLRKALELQNSPSPVLVAPELCNYEKQGRLDISKAKKMLDFKPTPVSRWMKITALWHSPLLK